MSLFCCFVLFSIMTTASPILLSQSLLLYSLLAPLPQPPSLPSTLRKGQVFHETQYNTAYQVVARLRTSPCVKAAQNKMSHFLNFYFTYFFSGTSPLPNIKAEHEIPP